MEPLALTSWGQTRQQQQQKKKTTHQAVTEGKDGERQNLSGTDIDWVKTGTAEAGDRKRENVKQEGAAEKGTVRDGRLRQQRGRPYHLWSVTSGPSSCRKKRKITQTCEDDWGGGDTREETGRSLTAMMTSSSHTSLPCRETCRWVCTRVHEHILQLEGVKK